VEFGLGDKGRPNKEDVWYLGPDNKTRYPLGEEIVKMMPRQPTKEQRLQKMKEFQEERSPISL